MSKLSDAQNPTDIKTEEAPASAPLVDAAVDLPGTKEGAGASVAAQLAAMSARLELAEKKAKAAEAEISAIKSSRLNDGASIIMEHCNTCGFDVTDNDDKKCPNCTSSLINAVALDRVGRPFIASQALH